MTELDQEKLNLILAHARQALSGRHIELLHNPQAELRDGRLVILRFPAVTTPEPIVFSKVDFDTLDSRELANKVSTYVEQAEEAGQTTSAAL